LFAVVKVQSSRQPSFKDTLAQRVLHNTLVEVVIKLTMNNITRCIVNKTDEINFLELAAILDISAVLDGMVYLTLEDM